MSTSALHARKAAPSAAAGRWRLTLFSLAAFVLLAGLLAAITGLYYRAETGSTWTQAVLDERAQVALQSQIIVGVFQSIVADLRFLARSQLLQQMLATDPAGPAAELAEEFRRFAESKEIYDQLRYLDEDGNEAARVNWDAGRPRIVPEEELQSKASRYYFTDASRLPAGAIFVSPFDLNVENDRIEEPIKPTIRFAAPVFDGRGARRGIVILNYLGAGMIDRLRAAAANASGDMMLLNAEGFWLVGPSQQLEWGFMYADRGGQSFAALYPDAWRQITSSDEGQFVNQYGLFTFQTLRPLAAALGSRDLAGGESSEPAYAWKIVSRVPVEVINARSASLRRRLLQLNAVLWGVLAGAIWLVARTRSARQAASEALAASEQRFRQLADNIDEVFWIASADGSQMLYLSPAYQTVFGRPLRFPDERSRCWVEGVHPDDRTRLARAFDAVSSEGGFDIQYRVIRPDGSLRWIRDRGFAIRGPDGGIERLAGLADDVTHMREANERLLQSERLAAIGEAMAGLAHESRNALQRSQAGLELLARRLGDQPEPLRLISEVRLAQAHLHQLYESVRGYASPMPLDRKPADLKVLLEQAWRQSVDGQAGEEPRLVFAELPDDLVCEIDSFALGRVWSNVLDNALAAAGPAAEVRACFVATQLAGRPALRVTLADNGPGLTEEQLRRMFDPFFTTKVRGTGLGLSLAKRIVEAHGGRIEARQAGTGGAEIAITLPRKADGP